MSSSVVISRLDLGHYEAGRAAALAGVPRSTQTRLLIQDDAPVPCDEDGLDLTAHLVQLPETVASVSRTVCGSFLARSSGNPTSSDLA